MYSTIMCKKSVHDVGINQIKLMNNQREYNFR